MLSQSLIDDLLKHAEIGAPEEMCGLLFGEWCWYAPNISKTPCESFEISQEDFLYARDLHKASPWAIVHSHPGKSAAPSTGDCLLMDAFAKIGYPMQLVIVGLEPKEIRCYKRVGDVYGLEWKHVVP